MRPDPTVATEPGRSVLRVSEHQDIKSSISESLHKLTWSSFYHHTALLDRKRVVSHPSDVKINVKTSGMSHSGRLMWDNKPLHSLALICLAHIYTYSLSLLYQRCFTTEQTCNCADVCWTDHMTFGLFAGLNIVWESSCTGWQLSSIQHSPVIYRMACIIDAIRHVPPLEGFFIFFFFVNNL